MRRNIVDPLLLCFLLFIKEELVIEFVEKFLFGNCWVHKRGNGTKTCLFEENLSKLQGYLWNLWRCVHSDGCCEKPSIYWRAVQCLILLYSIYFEYKELNFCWYAWEWTNKLLRSALCEEYAVIPVGKIWEIRINVPTTVLRTWHWNF